MRVVGVVGMLAVLAGCGYIGDPQPPTLDIPLGVTDLRAMEYGDRVIVEFTIPLLTTENLPLKSTEPVELFAAAAGTPTIDAWLAQARAYPVPSTKPGPHTFELPARDWSGKTMDLRVRSTGPKGRKSAWSNLVILEVIAPLATPTNFRVSNVEKGVGLTWQGAGPKYRVFRATGAAAPQPLGDTDRPEYLDTTSIYGIAYRYQVQAIAQETQQSVLTDPVPITPKDEFAPAVPEGVSGLASVRSIELVWGRNTEEDFASYKVYRSVDGGPFTLVAMDLDAPAYSDSQIEAGKKYRYEISAVDKSGNESAHTAPVEIAAP